MDGVKACIAQLHQLKIHASGLRKVHLRNCLINAEDAEDIEKFKGILRVIEREEQRSMWQSIRRVTNEPRLGAITMVQRETEEGVVELTDMEEMCTEIQEVTERRFELAESAPVTNSSLRQSIGFLANTEFASRLVSGQEPIPPDIDGSTGLVIKEMQRLWSAEGSERFQAFRISLDDCRRFWNRVNEATSSSMSNLHFGLQKAAMFSDIITSFIPDKISVIGSYSCPPARWASGLQVMLEKIAGVALVNKLRAILLMESDYNFFNKWVFGHLALNRLYQEGYIPEDQYSQRESTAEDARLDNRLTMDLSRQLRIPLVTVSVDADKCYDRINHIIMGLTLLAIVGASGLITALLHPIQTMKFYQRTAWGDSKSYMGGRSNDNPLQGLCQGNGAAPACWLMISSLLMHCYKRQGFGSSILSPISLALILFLGEMYVDDTDLIIMKPEYKSAEDVKADAQSSIDAWANLLISTGGALNPDKCYWYNVDYKCVDGEWVYSELVDWGLSIPLPDGNRKEIARANVDEAKKMLGIWSCPTGKDKKHIETNIIQKYKTWVDRSKNGHLPTKLNWISYNYKLWPGMRYGLATLATPLASIRDTFRKLDYEALPLLGVNRSVKREWRTIPRAFGGIGLISLPIEQTIGWANMLLQHYGAPTVVGGKCLASLEALQLEIGCTGNPLLENYNDRNILATPCWMKAIWERFQVYSFPIILDYNEMECPRERDITIVELLLQQGIRGPELRRLNRCRIALKAIFLSDIATAGGRHLEHWVLENRIGRSSKYKFPREIPCSKDWDLWDEFWTSWLRRDNTMPITLGKWTAPSHQNWAWFYEPDSNSIWNRMDDGWIEYAQYNPAARTTRNSHYFTPVQRWQSHDLKGVPASIAGPVSQISLQETGPPLATTVQQHPSFWEYVDKQGGTWMWEYVEGKQDDMTWVTDALRNHTAVMVTDGSFKRSLAPRISGASWILVCTSSKKAIFGSFHEYSDAASSYRGELLGLTAIHLLITFIMDYYALYQTGGSVHCDNKGALYQASLKRKRVKMKAHHSDLLRSLRYLKNKHRMKLQYFHVKAHQDDHTPWKDLPLVQQLNCKCDDLAKQAVHMSTLTSHQRTGLDQLLPREQAAVIVDGMKQTTDVGQAIRFSLGKAEARKFFTRPVRLRANTNIGGLGWSTDKFEAIDWESLREVLSKKPDMYGIWLSKQTIGICATRKNMARILGLDDDRCPNCLEGPEQSTHLNRCKDQGRSELYESGVNELSAWMAKNSNTDIELRFWLITYLMFRGERSMLSLGELPPALHEVARDIDKIGWEDMMHGRVPLSLLTLQQSHCAMTGSRMTGKDWMRAFITKILDISHGQWMYRNFSLHNKTQGHLQLQRQTEVLAEIATLADSRPEDIPAESRFLLEVEVTNTLENKPLVQQEYWIAAMKAAIKAGSRSHARHHRRSTGSSNTSNNTTTITHRRNLYRFQRRIALLERQLREDLDLSSGSWRQKRKCSDCNAPLNGSNKRFRKPD